MMSNVMLSEIAGKAIADANIAETAKVQKGAIIDALAGANGRGVARFTQR